MYQKIILVADKQNLNNNTSYALPLILVFTYLWINSAFFQEVGAVNLRHRSHHHNSEIVCLLSGSFKLAPGMSSAVNMRGEVSPLAVAMVLICHTLQYDINSTVCVCV